MRIERGLMWMARIRWKMALLVSVFVSNFPFFLCFLLLLAGFALPCLCLRFASFRLHWCNLFFSSLNVCIFLVMGFYSANKRAIQLIERELSDSYVRIYWKIIVINMRCVLYHGNDTIEKMLMTTCTVHLYSHRNRTIKRHGTLNTGSFYLSLSFCCSLSPSIFASRI